MCMQLGLNSQQKILQMEAHHIQQEREELLLAQQEQHWLPPPPQIFQSSIIHSSGRVFFLSSLAAAVHNIQIWMIQINLQITFCLVGPSLSFFFSLLIFTFILAQPESEKPSSESSLKINWIDEQKRE